MENQSNFYCSNKKSSIIIVFILTVALVVTMIPFSANNKVNADTSTLIDRYGPTSTKYSDTFEDGTNTSCSIKYKLVLKYRAPVRVVISSEIPSPAAVNKGYFRVELKNESGNVTIANNKDNKGARVIQTGILNAGTYYLTFSANENDENSWEKRFWFYVENPGNLTKSSYIHRNYNSTYYTGKPINFIKEVRYGAYSTSPLLYNNQDYIIRYSNGNTKPGSGTISVIGINGFYGIRTFPYTIMPSKKTISSKKTSISSSRVKKRQLKIKWKTISSANYYQIKYRVKGTSKWKSKTVSGAKRFITLTKLKKGKKYQYKVRGVQKLKGYPTYYSKYSKTKLSLKIK